MVENAEFEQDIDYIMHIEHEVPMLWYSKLDPIKKDIAKMVAYRCKIAVRDAERRQKYKIIADLKEHVGGILREEDIPQW